MPTSITAGSSDAMTTTFNYGQNNDVVTNERTTTTTTYDTWRRPTQILTTSLTGDDMMLQESFTYEPSGQLDTYTRKQGRVDVRTTYLYDIMGRVTFVSTDNASVGASANSTVHESTSYNAYASGTITKTSSTGLITRHPFRSPRSYDRHDDKHRLHDDRIAERIRHRRQPGLHLGQRQSSIGARVRRERASGVGARPRSELRADDVRRLGPSDERGEEVR